MVTKKPRKRLFMKDFKPEEFEFKPFDFRLSFFSLTYPYETWELIGRNGGWLHQANANPRFLINRHHEAPAGRGRHILDHGPDLLDQQAFDQSIDGDVMAVFATEHR